MADIDIPITSLDQSWEDYKGTRVEQFLKELLRKHEEKKIGALNVMTNTDGTATMRAFKDDDARKTWESNQSGNASLVLASVTFAIGSGGGGPSSDEYTLSTRVTQNLQSDMVKGSSNILKFSYNCYYGGDPTDLDTEQGYARVWVNNTEITALAMSLNPGGNEYSMDLGPYLVQETNAVILEVGNKYGKNRRFTFTVNALEIILSLHESYDESILRDGPWSLRVECRGATAQVHVSVDGKEIGQSTITNSTNDFIIDEDNKLAGGSHKIEVYAENSSFNLRTDTIVTYFIKSGLSTPSICIGTDTDTTVMLYGTARIPYFLYYPNMGNRQVQITAEIQNISGTKQADLASQTLTLKSDGTSGSQELRVNVNDSKFLSLGYIDVVIKCGTASAKQRLQVIDSGVNLDPATECKIYLSAAGRTNADDDAEDWHSEYNNVRTCSVKRSENFILNSTNGFINDAFLIKAGKSITLDGFLPFGEDFGVNATNSASRTGRTFEFEFKVSNCTNSDTKIIECMNAGIGFIIYANRIELYSDAGGNVETIYSDEQKTRVGFCIDGNTTHCVNKLIDSTEESDANIAYVYLNGVIVRMMDYKTSNWQQPNPQKIVIGSEDCDIELYTVRIYDKSLNYQQMLGNYAYDTPDINEKIAIAKRNNVLDSTNSVDFAKVLQALPNTPYKIWEISKMPTGKKDWQKASTQFVNPAWENEPNHTSPEPNCSFTCKNHDIALDGTSSLSYPDPYKNWADKFNGEWTVNINGTEITILGFSLSNGIDMKAIEFVDKVNFASSEGIFNILTANAYQNILTGAAKQFPTLLTKKQASQQSNGLPISFRQSLAGYPIIGWLREQQGVATIVRFLSLYNVVNNKYDPYPFGFDNSGKDELWEVEDNVNFFSEMLDEGKWNNGAWDDKSTVLYYARVPKTSPTTGQDYGVAGNAQEVTQANKETAKLRRFHNWIYSCNPNIAERYKLVHGSYEKLPTSVKYGDTTYTEDTPAYRIAKFNNEYSNYLNKQSALFYFIYFSWTLGVDSMDKNMTIGFEESTGNPIAFLVQRDSDTGFRYGNRGTLIFQAFHEWGDSYDESTGETGVIEGETYDPQTQTFSVKCSKGSPIFNGRLSGLWDCVAQAWGDDIKAMYQAMRSNGLNENAMWNLYNSFWSQWCEALYNVDGMGYANTGRFDMAHGDKREVLRHFFKYRQRYWDSKCGANTSQALEFRLWGTGNGVALRYAIPLYASLNWGAGGIQTIRNINPGQPAYFKSNGATFNETTFTIYDADLLTEVSTYVEGSNGDKIESGLQNLATSCDITGLEYCKKLERLILDYSGKAPNTNLSSRVTNVGNSIALKELVIRNCPNVTGAINLQSEKIETIDLRDTGITGLTIPETSSLTTIYLGNYIRSITFKNLPNLFTLEIGSTAQVSTVEIESCPKLNNARNLIETILSNPNNVLRTVKLRDISWSYFNLKYLERLAELKADLTGRIILSDDQVVTFDLKRKFIEAWGDIDDNSNPLVISYVKKPITSVSIGGRGYVTEPGQYQYSIIPNDPNGNTFKKVEWSIESNNYAVMSRTGLMTVSRIGDEATKPTAKITAVVTLSDNSQLTAELNVGFYEKTCAVGDYVYADGSYSDMLDTSKTLVGVCFYIDPNNKKNRLCVAPKALTSYPWGLYNGSSGFSNVALRDTPDYNVYDVPTLTNKSTAGASNATDQYMRDEANGDADGWKIQTAGTAVAEIGWEAADVALGGYQRDTLLPIGLINTLKIIEHRNIILRDSSVNQPLPQKTDSQSEYDNLIQIMNDFVSKNGNTAKYRQYYYPAASQCNSWEPTVKPGEELADCFKAGKWFLPSCGELARIYWYHSKGYTPGTENAIFANAVSAGVFTRFPASGHWSSTEYSQNGAWYVSFSGGYLDYNYAKNGSYEVRAVAAF